MNAIDGTATSCFRSLATRGAGRGRARRRSTTSWRRPRRRRRPGHRRDARASARATRPSSTTSTCSLYVMTPEFGAASQLEKIDMLDFADVVAINKFDRRGAEDALRDVRRQMVRNHEAFGASPDDLPVFGTIASRFNDDGVTALYQHLRDRLAAHGLATGPGRRRPWRRVDERVSTADTPIVPPGAGALPGRRGRGRPRPPPPGRRAGRGRPRRQQVRAVQAMLAAAADAEPDAEPMPAATDAASRPTGPARRPGGRGRRPAGARGPPPARRAGRPRSRPTPATSWR